jgi:hypothetical protein
LVDFVFTPGALKRIRELVNINLREVAIAADLGCDVPTLRKIAAKHGLPLKKPNDDDDRGSAHRDRKYNRSPWVDFKGGGNE